MVSAAQVQILIGGCDLVICNANVAQGDRCTAMSEHLLKNQQLSLAIPRHHHLMISECLPKRVGGHVSVDMKFFSNAFQNLFNGVPVDWFIHPSLQVSVAAEHVVAQSTARILCKEEFYRVHDRHVNCNVSVLLHRSGLLRFLFQNGEGLLKGAIFIDEITEPQSSQIAYTKSKVDAYDEEHVVPVTVLVHQEVADPLDISDVFDWSRGSVLGYLSGHYLS